VSMLFKNEYKNKNKKEESRGTYRSLVNWLGPHSTFFNCKSVPGSCMNFLWKRVHEQDILLSADN
jgi:hypothetical protein